MELSRLVDRTSLADVLVQLAQICDENEQYQQDTRLAGVWGQAADAIREANGLIAEI
jgi:hypothetical protein